MPNFACGKLSTIPVDVINKGQTFCHSKKILIDNVHVPQDRFSAKDAVKLYSTLIGCGYCGLFA
jgi:hypothetical protein